MIRKTTIVVLTLAAAGTSVAWVASRSSNVRLWPFSASPARVALDLFEDRVHLFVASGLAATAGGVPPSVRGTKAESRYRVTPPQPWEQYDVTLGRTLSVPLWPILLVMLTYPVAAFIRGPFRRYRRRRRGECLDCGYDLTGNVSGICPECGTKID